MGLFFCAFLATLPVPVRGDDCFCTAPDGTCSADVSCAGGCWAVCGPPCSAGCSGSGSGPGGGARNPAKLSLLFSLEQEAITGEDLAKLLSEQSGLRFAYVSPGPLSLDISGIPYEDLLPVLARNGVVAVVHDDDLGSPKTLAEARFSFRADSAPASTVAEALAEISGGAVEFIPRSRDQQISVDLKRVSALDLVQIFSGMGRVRVTQSRYSGAQ